MDYRDYEALKNFFARTSPEVVFLAAGRVGGIVANKTYPAEFLSENLAVQNNFFRLAHEFNVKTLVFFASSCVYPKFAEQPIGEDSLFGGPIESTSKAYAAAKIAGIVACESYNQQYSATKMICLLPNSLYGPYDDFSNDGSHVLSALIRKIHDAHEAQQEKVVLWGSGNPKREFLFSEDAAEAAIFAVLHPEKFANEHYNVGSGDECSIKELATEIAQIIGYKGKIEFDSSKPDGTPRKLLDSSKILKLGWKPSTRLNEGLKVTYEWYRNHQN